MTVSDMERAACSCPKLSQQFANFWMTRMDRYVCKVCAAVELQDKEFFSIKYMEILEEQSAI